MTWTLFVIDLNKNSKTVIIATNTGILHAPIKKIKKNTLIVGNNREILLTDPSFYSNERECIANEFIKKRAIIVEQISGYKNAIENLQRNIERLDLEHSWVKDEYPELLI
jgi:hypothetical protein